MTKRPRSSPPPARPGLARRGGATTPYKRPVQSPDAETVMLAKFTADPDVDPEAPDAEPPSAEQLTPQHRAAELSASNSFSVRNRRDPDIPAEDESDEPSTRVLVLSRGKRGAGPEQFSAPSARRTWVSRAALGAILCVQAILSLRLQNTAFGDEALYLYAGHMETARLLHGAALQGDYASYFPGVPVLYPVLAAAANSVGGLAAARAVSLLAMLITTALLYAMTRRLFNERVGLCAAAVFCVTEGTTLAGHLATNDAVSLCLLALASWIVVRTASWRWRAYLLAVPVAGLAIGTDYWALLYLPTLALLAGLAADPYLGRPALTRSAVLCAVTVELLAIGVLVEGRTYVTAAVATLATRSPGGGQALHILAEAGQWAGLVVALAAFGAASYAVEARNERNEHVALPGSRRRRTALGIVLAGTALLALADHLYLNTDNLLDTHLCFGLFFAAPMAGVGLARLVGDHFRRAQIGVVIWAAALVLGLAQATQAFGSWPDSSTQVMELSRYLGPSDRYLVENDNVAIYYLMGNPDAQPDQFTSTYFMAYRTPKGQLLTGTPAYLAALQAGYFRVVIYDSSVTPALDRSLAAALESDPRYRLAGAVPEDARDFRTTCYVWIRT
jgi:4-amino-4-deoxy-L-arabinose transferase-like glycosyltransferase